MKSVTQRFEEKVFVAAGLANSCHLWTAQTDKDGYGQFSVVPSEKYQAHRFAYKLYVGLIPAGKVVMHTCDVRCCVNPDHLRVGTQADNMADMEAKGRSRRPGRPKKVVS